MLLGCDPHAPGAILGVNLPRLKDLFLLFQSVHWCFWFWLPLDVMTSDASKEGRLTHEGKFQVLPPWDGGGAVTNESAKKKRGFFSVLR